MLVPGMPGASRPRVEVGVPCVAFEDLVEAAGGADALAHECGVPAATVQSWIAGDVLPTEDMRHVLAHVARELGVLPAVRSRSGCHLLAPEFVPRAWILAGLRAVP
jgi:hypothetical protein